MLNTREEENKNDTRFLRTQEAVRQGSCEVTGIWGENVRIKTKHASSACMSLLLLLSPPPPPPPPPPPSLSLSLLLHIISQIPVADDKTRGV